MWGGVERPTISFQLNSSQDGIVVPTDSVAPCHTSGHGNCPKIYEAKADNDNP